MAGAVKSGLMLLTSSSIFERHFASAAKLVQFSSLSESETLRYSLCFSFLWETSTTIKNHGGWDEHWRDREVCSSGWTINNRRCSFATASTFFHATSWSHLVWTRSLMPVTHPSLHLLMGTFCFIAKQLLLQSLNFLDQVLPFVFCCSLSRPGISSLIAKGVYDAAFPLHDVSMSFRLLQDILAICSIISTMSKKKKKKKAEIYWCTLPIAKNWFIVVEICKLKTVRLNVHF